MAGKVSNYNYNDQAGSVIGNKRILDEYYTGRGTKLYVENGVLVEENIDPSSHVSFAPTPRYAPCLPQYLPQCRTDSPALSRSGPKIMPPSPSDIAAGLAQNRRNAEAALKFYNTKHGAKFSLVEPICSGGKVWQSGIWFHCNFKAKLEGHEDSTARLFFGEMKLVGPSLVLKYLVTACCPLDDGATSMECDMCGAGAMVHPMSHQMGK